MTELNKSLTTMDWLQKVNVKIDKFAEEGCEEAQTGLRDDGKPPYR